jgi:hypothetical protein
VKSRLHNALDAELTLQCQAEMETNFPMLFTRRNVLRLQSALSLFTINRQGNYIHPILDGELLIRTTEVKVTKSTGSGLLVRAPDLMHLGILLLTVFTGSANTSHDFIAPANPTSTPNAQALEDELIESIAADLDTLTSPRFLGITNAELLQTTINAVYLASREAAPELYQRIVVVSNGDELYDDDQAITPAREEKRHDQFEEVHPHLCQIALECAK